MSDSPTTGPVALVLGRLGEKARVKPTSNGWEARCPAHEDDRASLSVKAGDDGRALLICHAGCTLPAICDGLGLRARELFVQRADQVAPPPVRAPSAPASAKQVKAPSAKPKAALGRIVDTYDYVDEQGGHLFQVVRFEPKEFRQRRRDPQGKNGWTWKLGGARQVVYRLPRVLEAVKAGATIWVVEGEKDVAAMEGLQLVATCNAGGASKNRFSPKWRAEHAEALAGAKRVVVIADKDSAGRAHAAAVAQSLLGRVAEVKVLELPGNRVKDAADWIAQGGTREQLERLATDAPIWTPPPESPPHGGSGGGGDLPIVLLGHRQLRDVLNDCWDVVHRANEPPTVFWRGGLLATIAEGEGGAHIQETSTTWIYGHLARVATWMAPNPSGELVSVYPDAIAAKDMQDRPDPKLPALDAVIGCPVFAADGQLLAEPGYHRASKLWLHRPEGFVLPPVPLVPTAAEFAAAKALILENWLVDFKFASEADRAHAIAALLQPLVRRLIPGLTPIFLIEAPSAGSGKGLFADQVSIIVMGENCAVTTYTTDEDELRKRITATLVKGRPVVLIDNVNDEINSAQLASVTTTDIWEDRILGYSQMVYLRNRATWLVTANNPTMTEELARRCIRIRIDRKIDRPWKLGGFLHDDLRAWAKAERPRLVHALLVLVRAWLAAGRPDCTGARLGSFETWSRIMGGILEVAGITGFLANTDEMYEQADAKGREWREFVRAWCAQHQAKPLKVGELVGLVARLGLLPTKLKGKSFPARCSELGKLLGADRGKRYEDLVLSDQTDSHTKTTSWQLLQVAPPAVATPAQRELIAHWSDAESKAEASGEIDRGSDPDAY